MSLKRMCAVGGLVVAGLVAAGAFWGCDEGTAENSVSIDVIDGVSGIANSTFAVTGSYEADTVPTITAEVLDSANNVVNTAMMWVTMLAATEDKADLQDLELTIHVGANGACNGDYKLRITVATSSEVSQSIGFTVTDGINCATSSLLPVKGAARTIYNGCGTARGSYDLVADSLVPVSAAAALGDIRDTSTCGVSFDQKWKSMNGAKFLHLPSAMPAMYRNMAYDSVTATGMGVMSSMADTSTATIIGPLGVGDVVFVKLSGTRGLASIKVVAVDPTDNTGGTLNPGSLTFDYKFLAAQ